MVAAGAAGGGIFHIRFIAGGGANSAALRSQTVLHLLRVYGKFFASSQWQPPLAYPPCGCALVTEGGEVWCQGAGAADT